MKQLLLLLALLPCGAVQAQQGAGKFIVSGAVADSAGRQPIAYATAALVGADGVPLSAGATDEKGRFELRAREAGDYRLQVSMVGYQPIQMPVAAREQRTDLGTLLMRQGVAIDEVVVAVQKPLMVADAEKISYNVDADPEAATSTLSDIMRKIPQLSVDAEGNVQLNGQSDYKVLVNGRSSSMMSKNFKTIIESMPAGTVKNIEVITSPSTKYEAEGVGGIINIITNSKIKSGYNGSLRAGYSFMSKNPWTNLYFAAQLGKLSLSASYFANRYEPRKNLSFSERTNFDNQALHTLRDEGYRQYRGYGQGVTINSSYEFDTLNLLTVELSSWWGNNRSRSFTRTEAFDVAQQEVFAYDNDVRSLYDWNWNVDGSVNYQHTFSREDHTLTLSYAFERAPDEGMSTNMVGNVTGSGRQPYSRRQWEDNSDFNNTVQIDYFNPINEHHSIEAGTKFIYRHSSSDSRTGMLDAQGDYEIDPTYPRSDLDYTQNILGVYAGYHLKGKKLTGRVGGRLEQAWNDVKVTTEKDRYGFAPSLFNVIPYVSLSYRPSEPHTLSLSYTQRLRRPSIWRMNPYRDESDPLNVSYGNPDLDASVWHSTSFSYRLFSDRWTFMLGLTNFVSNNNVTRYTFVDKQGVSNSTYGNILSSQAYGFNGSLGYRAGTKFNATISFRGNYSIFDAKKIDLHNEGFGFHANANVGVELWKNASFRANGYVSTGNVALQSDVESTFYFYSFGLRQQLFDRKFDVNVSVMNPFNKNSTYRTNSQGEGFATYAWTQRPVRGVSISLGWRFGKTQVDVKSTNRSIENDDSDGGAERSTGAPE